MAPSRDCYAILGIESTADSKTIKIAYKAKALCHHPDKNPNDSKAQARFVEVQDAWEILSDPLKRARHDLILGIDRPRPQPTSSPQPSYSSSYPSSGHPPATSPFGSPHQRRSQPPPPQSNPTTPSSPWNWSSRDWTSRPVPCPWAEKPQPTPGPPPSPWAGSFKPTPSPWASKLQPEPEPTPQPKPTNQPRHQYNSQTEPELKPEPAQKPRSTSSEQEGTTKLPEHLKAYLRHMREMYRRELTQDEDELDDMMRKLVIDLAKINPLFNNYLR